MELGGEEDYIPIATLSPAELFLHGERGRLYTYRYTVTTRMIPALRWAAMRAILMFHNSEGQIQKTVSTDHNF